MRAALAILAGLLLFPLGGAANAQSSVVDVSLCPKTIKQTCFIGYVTAKSKVLVLLVSDPDNPLHGIEVDVLASAKGQPAQPLDLSKADGAVVMLDATSDDKIYGAKLIFTGDPLVTALYVSAFLGSSEPDNDPAGGPPQ